MTTEFVFPPVPSPDAPPMPDPMPDPIPDPDMPDPMPEPVPPVRRGGAGTVPLRSVLPEAPEPGDEPVEPPTSDPDEEFVDDPILDDEEGSSTSPDRSPRLSERSAGPT